MSADTTSGEAPTEPTTSEDQDWGRVALCVVVAIIAALGIHYVLFEVVITGMNLSPTVHAFAGMVLFFFAGFISFSTIY